MAKMYQTQLLAAAATKKPTFAGYYIVAHWGCGTICEQVALIDVRTGKVYFPSFATSVGNRHRIDSRLFIVDPPEDIAIYDVDKSPGDPPLQTSYWLWNEKAKQFKSTRSELPSLKGR